MSKHILLYTMSIQQPEFIHQTTIRVYKDVTEGLRKLRLTRRESYDEIIRRLLNKHDKN